jgi:hypothetical protein
MRIILFLFSLSLGFANSVSFNGKEITIKRNLNIVFTATEGSAYYQNGFAFVDAGNQKYSEYVALNIPVNRGDIEILDVQFDDYVQISYLNQALTNALQLQNEVLQPKGTYLKKSSADFYNNQRFFQLHLYPVRHQSEIVSLPQSVTVRLRYTRDAPLTSGGNDDFFVFAPAAQKQPQNAVSLRKSTLANTDWWIFTILDNNVYKFGKTEIDSWNIPADNPEDIHFFSWNGEMLARLTTRNFPEEMPELAFYIENHTPGNGWQSDETIFVYLRGTRFFHYDSTNSTSEFTFQNHNYSYENKVWLMVDNTYSNVITPAGAPPSGSQLNEAEMHYRYEVDETNRLASGYYWTERARAMKDNPYQLDLEFDENVCLDCSDRNMNVRMQIFGGNKYKYYDDVSMSHRFKVQYMTTSDTTTLINTWSISNYVREQANFTLPLTSTTGAKFNIDYTAVSPAYSSELGKYHFDYYEVNYPIKLRASNRNFEFYHDYSDGAVRWLVTNSASDDMVWNVTFANNPSVADKISNTFTPDFLTGETNSLVFVDRDNTPVPPAPVAKNYAFVLRDPNRQSDMIMVTSPQHHDLALEYAQVRENWSSEPFAVEVVTTEQIYNEFSAGVKDVTAIRNFFRYAWLNRNIPPKFAFLFGDGSFDPRGISYDASTYDLIPTYQISSDYETRTYTSDFYFADLNQSSSQLTNFSPEINIGRLPVNTATEIQRYIDKVDAYKRKDEGGAWLNNFLLIADDLKANDSVNETVHYNGAENIYNILPKRVNTDKIYLETYPFEIGGLGRVKPAATNDFINKVNQGQSVVVYIGHGAPDKWAHETLYDMGLHRNRIANKYKCGFWVALSCDISKYDDPSLATMAEDLILRPDDGAIWVLAATRLVTANANNSFGRNMFNRLYNSSSQLSIAEAVTQTITNASPNDLKYVLFGDPSLPFFDTKNTVETSDIVPGDTLKSLSLVEVRGTLHGEDGLELEDFNGKAAVRIFDAEDTLQHKLSATQEIYDSFTISGPTLFKGKVGVQNGEFSTRFFIPKSIKYSPSASAKMLFYAWDVSTGRQASGLVSNISIFGSESNFTDFNGPDIDLTIDGINSGPVFDIVTQNSSLVVELSDSSGINVSGEAGHAIALYTNANEWLDLTDYFDYDENSATSGVLRYPLSLLEVGTHQLKLQAWDNANNLSTTEFTLEIRGSDAFGLEKVVNYPNPMRDETWFTCQVFGAVNAKIEVSVYTLRGRKLIELSQTVLADGFQNDIYWDGTDEFGQKLANGTYLYKVVYRSQGKEASKIEKLVILR